MLLPRLRPMHSSKLSCLVTIQQAQFIWHFTHYRATQHSRTYLIHLVESLLDEFMRQELWKSLILCCSFFFSLSKISFKTHAERVYPNISNSLVCTIFTHFKDIKSSTDLFQTKFCKTWKIWIRTKVIGWDKIKKTVL